MSHFSNTTPYGLVPLNGNRSGPGNNSASAVQIVDIGTPNYRPATNYNSVVFNARGDGDGALPTRGIFVSSLLEEGASQRLEGAADKPFESTPVGEADSIQIEFHWPAYLRFAVNVSIAYNSGGPWRERIVRQHTSRSSLAQTIAEHSVRYFGMAQLESQTPSPVPLGTTYSPGATTGDMLLRSLDPFINPEGRVVWVPHFAVRYPLGEGLMRRITQRTRW